MTDNTKKPLILVVEDNEDMARLNARLLKTRGYETLNAASASETLQLLQQNAPDLIIIDVGLPGCDGFSLCSQIREQSCVPVMFITDKETTGDKIKGLQAGGDYYLTKPYDAQEFAAAAENLLSRAARYAGSAKLTRGTLTLDTASSTAYIDGKDAKLSQKEFSLLLLLASNEGKELTYEEIYEHIWGTDMLGESSALRKMVSRMKVKLNEANAADFAIFNKHGKGYMFMHMDA